MAEFKEYPKRVYPEGPGSPSVRVHDEAGEAEALKSARKAKAAAPVTSKEASGAPDRASLIAEAKRLGIKKPNFMKTPDLAAAVSAASK